MKLFVLGLLILGTSAELGDNYRDATEMIIQSWMRGEPFVVHAFTEDFKGYGIPPEFGGPVTSRDGLAKFLDELNHSVAFDLKTVSYEIQSVDTYRRSVTVVWDFPATSSRHFEKKTGATKIEIVYQFLDSDSPIPLCSGWQWTDMSKNYDQFKTKAHLAWEEVDNAFWSGDLPKVKELFGSAVIQWHGPDHNPWAQYGATNIDVVLSEWVPTIWMDPSHTEVVHSTDDIFIARQFVNMHYVPSGRFLGQMHGTYRFKNGIMSSVDWSFVEEPSRYAWFPSMQQNPGVKAAKGEL